MNTQAILEKISSSPPAVWNRWLAERNPKEEWLKFEPFKGTTSRFLAQIDSRKFFSDEMASWRNLQNIEISGFDFSGRDLGGMSVSGSKIQNTSFALCGLRGADFSDCTFENVTFYWALLSGATFARSRFIKTDFSNALTYCCNFEDCVY